MAELNLKQITDKLNSEFTGDVRKLVFWYDANAVRLMLIVFSCEGFSFYIG